MVPITAQADIFTFNNITNSGSPNIEDQLFVDVVGDASTVSFTFFHDPDDATAIDATIAQIYFDDNDGDLTSLNNIVNEPGVLFTDVSVSPGDLPAGDSISPIFDADFAFGADPPPADFGVDPGEELTIIFNADITEVLAALGDESLRIGLHVISIDNDFSDSFVVPEPTTMLLLGSSLVGLALCGRKRSRKETDKTS